MIVLKINQKSFSSQKQAIKYIGNVCNCTHWSDINILLFNKMQR